MCKSLFQNFLTLIFRNPFIIEKPEDGLHVVREDEIINDELATLRLNERLLNNGQYDVPLNDFQPIAHHQNCSAHRINLVLRDIFEKNTLMLELRKVLF